MQPGGTANANAGVMTYGDANTLAAQIVTRARNGLDLTLSAINTILTDTNNGGTANTDLDGAAASSKSFGTVEEILRILSGEVYLRPRFVIVADVAGVFQSQSERDALVTAQDTANNGGVTFLSTGRFLTRGEPGFREKIALAHTGAVNISSGAGQLRKLKDAVTFVNPAFAYASADVTSYRPRAYGIDGTAVPASGAHPVVVVYDHLGNAI